MTTRILLARHVSDYRRNEPRNVGVIIVGEDAYAARFIGEDDQGKLDGRRARRIVGVGIDIYREWVEFWREELKSGPQGLDDILAEVGANFYIDDAANVWDDEPHEPEVLLARYFDLLVGEPEADSADPRLSARVLNVLEHVGVTTHPGFKRNHEVGSDGLPRSVPIRFPYAVQNGELTVIDQADLANVPRVQTLLWRFDHVPRDVRRVAFYTANQLDGEAAAYLETLTNVGDALDIDAATVEENAAAVFG